MSDEQSIKEIRERKLKELQENGKNASKRDSTKTPTPINGQSELTEAAEAHEIVLVDFYADWCGPCQMLEPVVEDIAAETNAVIAKVDIDANQRLAADYGVQGVPTLLLFASGEPVKRLVGMQSKEALIDAIEQYS